MRTVSLEFLRHGPPHNQLLSPLTPYLALCGNHGAVTVHVPFEHNQFLHRLRALEYQDGDEREFQLADTGRALGELLSRVPGLTAELSRDDVEGGRVVHLRLILSASELALLPFELAIAQNGFPGAGQALLLQSQSPICMTREARRVPDHQVPWPRRAKILFVVAAPPSVGSVPMEAHLQALREAIDPWVARYRMSETTDANVSTPTHEDEIAKHLVVLPRATAAGLRAACATGEFTHIHILAHGLSYKEDLDVRYGIALHDESDPAATDIVSGCRLAAALRACREPEGKCLSSPAVVTLATCQGGAVGDVAGAGASVAHALHESDVPVVVASQFPLSFGGSVSMVHELYKGLLWGYDPRPLLNALRRQMRAETPGTHDWASLVAYLSLPPDFADQLEEAQFEQTKLAINAAMSFADHVIDRSADRTRKEKAGATVGVKAGGTDEEKAEETAARHRELEAAHAKVSQTKRRMAELWEQMPRSKKSRISGYLASTEKREAEIYLAEIDLLQRAKADSAPEQDLKLALAVKALERAMGFYERAFQENRGNSWALVQFISLFVVLKARNRPWLPDLFPLGEWLVARDLARFDLIADSPEHRVWAHGSLAELYLLALLMPDDRIGKRAEKPLPGLGNAGADLRIPTPGEAISEAKAHAAAMVELSARNSLEIYSTRRQFLRYAEIFPKLAPVPEPLIAAAREIAALFPVRSGAAPA